MCVCVCVCVVCVCITQDVKLLHLAGSVGVCSYMYYVCVCVVCASYIH